MAKARAKYFGTQMTLPAQGGHPSTTSLNEYLRVALGVDCETQKELVASVGDETVLVRGATGAPFLAVTFGELHSFNAAEAVLKNAVQNTETVGIGVLTDGTAENTRVLRRRFDRNEFEYVRELEPLALNLGGSKPAALYTNGASADGSELNLLDVRVEDVFFEIHSHMRDIDGLHADEALDELCKLLYLKLFDEETTQPGEPFKVQRWLYSSTEECAAAIRSIYKEANEYDLRVFDMKIPGYNRSRGVFNATIRLSSPALVRAVEAIQGYHLGKSSIDVKGRAFQKVLGPAMRSGMGQYFTPDPIIRFLSRIVGPTVRDLILDPFCGSGHFLTACLQLVRESHQKEDKAFHEFAFGKLHGIEKSDRMVRVAMTDMRLHGDGHSNIRCIDSLLALSNYPDIKPASFDIILTNPPFGSLLGPEATRQLGEYKLADGRGNVPLEIIGLERCIQLLRPGGKLGIVLPDGVLANRNSAYVRDWLRHEAKVRAIFSLPIETFVPFGASIKTSVLVVRKWLPGEARTNDYQVFLGRIDGVGYDAVGRRKDNIDLDAVAQDFAQFLDKEGW
jgi:type I restriction enzyme M protein